jgi:phage tail tape-measure protein
MGGNMANAYNMGMSAYDLSQMYQIKGSGNPWAGSGRGSAAGYQIGKNFGPYGAIIGAIAGGVYGFWQGARRKHEEDSYTYVKRTADNVAVTNNKLDIVNRNLVAIKSAIETYILPESAYLSEKSNLESQFSINAARGFT